MIVRLINVKISFVFIRYHHIGGMNEKNLEDDLCAIQISESQRPRLGGENYISHLTEKSSIFVNVTIGLTIQ